MFCQAQLSQTIQDMGGKVVSTVTEKTTICLSNQSKIVTVSVGDGRGNVMVCR